MNRLQAEVQRLYHPHDAQPPAAAASGGSVRAMVLERARPAQWEVLRCGTASRPISACRRRASPSPAATVMNDRTIDLHLRIEAAQALLPSCNHPRSA